MAQLPQLFPGRKLNDQWGPRALGGFHWGRDQPVPAGTPRIAPADGVVVNVGQDRNWGFFYDVMYDGSAKLIDKHHQVAHNSLPVKGQRFRKGDALGRVGKPYLTLTEAERAAKPDWSGSSKQASTGEHAHQQVCLERTTQTKEFTKDPRSVEVSAEWARVLDWQAGLGPIGGGEQSSGGVVTPLVPTSPEEDDMFSDEDRAKLNAVYEKANGPSADYSLVRLADRPEVFLSVNRETVRWIKDERELELIRYTLRGVGAEAADRPVEVIGDLPAYGTIIGERPAGY